MVDTASASIGVQLALLEGQLLTREIDRATFIERAADLGLPASAIGDAADQFMAIAANRAARRATLRSGYDCIVIGFVCAAEALTTLAPITKWKAAKSRTAMFIHTDSFGERWKKFLQRASLIDREPGQAAMSPAMVASRGGRQALVDQWTITGAGSTL
jgi:hypothetical protein